MFSKRLLVLVLAGLPALAFAQDVIILVSGQNLKGRMLRYDDNRFTMMVGTEVKEVAAEDIHSVFFGIDAPEPAIATPTNKPVVVAPKPAPVAPSVVAEVPVRPMPPYGMVEKSVSVDEYLLHGINLTGKVVKMEFFCRNVIRPGKGDTYLTMLSDSKSGVEVEFGKDAYAWFNQLPDQIVYTDLTRSKPRAYYLYGVVGTGKAKAMMDWLPAEANTLYPIGRKTKKGMRGTIEYGW
jgi:hypothetical protein